MAPFTFSKKDIAQIKENGLTESQVYSQISIFQKGTPYVTLERPCTAGDGIMRFTPDQIDRSLQVYSEKAVKRELTKFVPASGAATRMFKTLIQANNTKPSEITKLSDNTRLRKDLLDMMENCHRFAFYADLNDSLAKTGLDAGSLIKTGNFKPVLTHLLTGKGLNYASLPKGLIKFHAYANDTRTAFEEHLVEAGMYAKTEANDCTLHFTVAPLHEARFIDIYYKIRKLYENRFDANLHATFSAQKDKTNTIAVDLDNRPYRLADESLFFRPGGHGALIDNLNQLDADIVFIKNIDNVAHDRFKPEMVEWKKILCGHLISLQEQIFNFLTALHKNPVTPEPIQPELIQNALEFVEKELCVRLPGLDEDESPENSQNTRMKLIDLLNRPLRVCGMVPNVKEPGGGPFWIKDDNGHLSLQIIETSQINLKDPNQEAIFNQSTHFNPVDIVCGLTDFCGKAFDLSAYVDREAVFISQKSESGRDLKALEHPGLWNGSMAFWNTVFVEVPLITFNPVKQVTDLLREAHQPG